MKALSSFVMRYYYCLRDDSFPNEVLSAHLARNSYKSISGADPDFSDPGGFYLNLADASGRLAILAVKTPGVQQDWGAALEMLSSLEEQSAMNGEDLMGRLTLLAGADQDVNRLLAGAAARLPCREARCPAGDAPMFRLPLNRGDSEAVYVFRTAGEPPPAHLLLRRLPDLHAQMIYLCQLNTILRDRDNTICQEKDDLGKELIRILHTRLVMNQPSVDINKGLEAEVEDLATAFAKLVADKKLVDDGIKRLELMLDGTRRRFLEEPLLQLEPEQVGEMLAAYHKRREDLQGLLEELDAVEGNYRDAISVVQGKIQVVNSRTNIETQERIRELLDINLEMQKKSLVYQYAAGLIEFIILAYYGLSIWTNVAPIAAAVIPGWIKLVFVLMFSGTTVVVTHYLSEYLQGEDHVRSRLITVSLCLVIILTVIVLGTWSANLAPGVHATPPAH